MRSSAQLTSEQQKENIVDDNNTDKCEREVPEEVEDGEKLLDPANTSSEFNMVISRISNEFEPESRNEVIRHLNAHPIYQLTDDHVQGHRNSIPGQPRAKFLADQVMTIWFILRRCVWDADMPGELVEGEMGLGKTFTLVAVAMICKLVSEKGVMGLPLSILWGKTIEKWVILAINDCPGIVGEEWERYPLQRLHFVRCHLLEIQTTPPPVQPALVSALESDLIITMPRVAETFKIVIDDMKHGPNFKLVNMFHAENANLTHKDLNTGVDKPENQWNIHHVSQDTLISWGKQSSNSQLSYCAWSFGPFDVSQR